MKSFDEWCLEFLTNAGFGTNAHVMVSAIKKSSISKAMYFGMYEKAMQQQKPKCYINKPTEVLA